MSVEYKDYYTLLGVSRTATEKEIKSAFRKLAREYHPDVNAGNDKKFKDLNEAYEVLSDATKRQRYDSLGANYRHGSQFEPPPGYDFGGMGGFDFSQFSQGGQANGNFSDFFDILFGGQAPSSGRSSQRRSNPQLDIHHRIEITLEDLYFQNSKALQLSLPNGQTRSLSVKIPKGLKEGGKIKLKGEGNQQGPMQGDLILEVTVRPHPIYKIEGRHLVMELELPIPDLALGCEQNVTILDGQVLIKVPSRTEPGKKLRLKGKGLPGKTEQDTGDLYVKLKGTFSQGHTEEERALYQQLQRLYT
jgi:curved DNA-binding protein